MDFNQWKQNLEARAVEIYKNDRNLRALWQRIISEAVDMYKKTMEMVVTKVGEMAEQGEIDAAQELIDGCRDNLITIIGEMPSQPELIVSVLTQMIDEDISMLDEMTAELERVK